MLRYILGADQVVDIRFAVSPLNELGLSLRLLRDPSLYPLQLPWLRRTGPLRERLDLDVLRALCTPDMWTADFLNPAPRSPVTAFGTELAEVAQMPGHRFRRDLEAMYTDRGQALPPALDGDGAQVRDRVVHALDRYWDTCFAPWWPRMRQLLDADIVYRGHVLARRGLGALFNDLSDWVGLEGGAICVRRTSGADVDRPLGGDAVTMVPSGFTATATVPTDVWQEPLVLYPVRGLGTLWEASRPAASGRLGQLIGRARADVLVLLDHPMSSTDVARRLGVSTSAVNQQMRLLAECGLLNAARAGRSVLYLRSELGDRLVRRDADALSR